MNRPGSDAVPARLGGLASALGKDRFDERRLAELNDLLEPVERELERDCVAPEFPPILILGPPRGGTTLLSQALATLGIFGIASNFVAKFWRAPALGMRIERALGLRNGDPASNFRSVRGRTENWAEPSEFGYLWSRFFDLGQATHVLGATERAAFDAIGLCKAVAAIEREAGRRMVFKNNTWFSSNADLVAETLPGSILIVCERDPFYVAQSLLEQRIALHGDIEKWWSVRPADFATIGGLPPLARIAAQAAGTIRDMELSLAKVDPRRILRIGYPALTRDPRRQVARVLEMLGSPASSETGALERLPDRFDSTDRIRIAADQAAELKAHVLSFAVRYGIGAAHEGE
jgi:hypothetical protein